MRNATHTESTGARRSTTREAPPEWSESKEISGYGRWKAATTGKRINDALWSQRQDRLAEYLAEHAEVRGHPPVVLYFPSVYRPACLGCTWHGAVCWTEKDAVEAAAKHGTKKND